MAEAFAIIGLTSSILTFIEFGIKITSTFRAISSSADGTAAEIQELDKDLQQIHTRNQRILARKESRKASPDEIRIADTVVACESLAQDLRKIIQKLSRRPDARSRHFEAGRVTIQTAIKKGEIESLQKRLRQQDKKIREGLQAILDSQRHSELLQQLKKIHELHTHHEINDVNNLTDLKQEIIEISSENDTDTFEARVTRLRIKLEILDKETAELGSQADVIESLHFTGLEKRWTDLDVAAAGSNAWLYNSPNISFSKWLESSQSQIFSIQGLAGSGKSTLMKYAFEHPSTRAGLEKWANPLDLCCASHFFWNQGFPLQKSLVGLLRTLLYQIFRNMPSLVSLTDACRPNRDEWELEDLKDLLLLIRDEASLSTKFCFFIDGLDEYDGDESDIAQLIILIAGSPYIKLCVSTRYRAIFDTRFKAENLTTTEFTLAMQDFTKNDMKEFVETRLRGSKEFKTLELTDSSCTELMEQIADDAKGVWLWVFLVTRDIIHAANKKEGPRKFREIVEKIPTQLEKYFAHILGRVDSMFREEMAKFFLITIFEVQPLPLYAFYLLEKESENPNYAIEADISELPSSEVLKVSDDWCFKIKNRCSDLLTVGTGKHPVFLFLSDPVDFLHRTVRDFLRDWYHDELRKELTKPFIPPISLCRIMLFFLKKQPQKNLRSPKHYNSMIGLVDELLYYAREVERHELCKDKQFSPVEDILDEVDKVNTHLMKTATPNHWTHARDPPATRGNDEYRERGRCNYLALTVQARLVKYVESKLMADRRRLLKKGRPLLDYALRPRRVIPIQVPYHSQRDEPNIDPDMVKLLLSYDADPNQVVRSHEDRSVWALFLISCRESIKSGEATNTSIQAWYEVSKMLVEHGARRDCFSSDEPHEFQDFQVVLNGIFDEGRTADLLQRMDEAETQRKRTWPEWLRGIFGY